MKHKLAGKTVAALLVGVMLAASGCSTLSDYTINGVPADKLFADSGQVSTDANVDAQNQSYCAQHTLTCVLGLAIAWGVVAAFIQACDDNRNPPPAAAPAPAPAPPPPPGGPS
jgi:hypothetical protein